MVAETA